MHRNGILEIFLYRNGCYIKISTYIVSYNIYESIIYLHDNVIKNTIPCSLSSFDIGLRE